jgi:hypothetical protein
LSERGSTLGTLDRVVYEGADLRIVEQTLRHDLQAAKNSHEKVIEVVRDTAGQLTDGLHLLCLK